MIIQSLCRYYDILVEDEDVTISRPGYSSGKVSFALVLSPDGELSYIADLRSDDKKPRPKSMDVPLQEVRSSGIAPYVLCDNAKYVFGVEKLKRDKFEEKFPNPSGKDTSPDYTILAGNEKEVVLVHQRSRDCFEAFRERQHAIFDALDDPGIRALLTFLDSWSPENFSKHSKLVEYMDDLLAGGNLVFECEGVLLHRKPSVRKTWERYSSDGRGDRDTFTAQCLVTGEMDTVARIHQNLKGVAGAQMSGASLVSFNDDSFCSYGKTGKQQGLNAPISESAMFKYTTVLNYLLARPDYRMRIADTTVVFWAETNGTACEDLASLFFDPREETEEDSDAAPSDPARVQDLRRIELIGAILDKVRKGQKIHTEDIGADPEANFYMLGLSPNNARLAVRFWHVDTFGNFIVRAARHHLDMEIVRDGGPRYVSMYRLLRETVAPSSDNKAASPLLGGLVMRSILNGGPYPVQMYSAILNRTKVDRSINPIRAGFIKAYLLRLARAGLTNLQEDMITVSLNEENPSVPYRLGRLFAVLEKAQADTNREMKSTINSKYFSSASTTPAVVFPVLLKLAQHHIAKSDWGFRTTQAIEETLTGVDEFPAYLSLEEQGMFMLGYYHQRKANYKKKEEVAGEVE
ncbi:type I-C CRISPR-associated protein Cas8c/Csd1 [Methanoculleus sp. Wushi-C6]|uniref:Type I-C CRISPR-associated protein Cas8c/Csd1 n=1 Tax=Methanoculleus caldifontis TaxID=2651577 RepID=A0ABU3X233_9EURY|nr:type I-C CRISPR-associated protein Cas8c/Csd1 [Methanoculleus sp. Wushi-C6]MDV2481637.1 type I-C CRISPR-associated protein Cas8c/Csd1 [Methanoculleus sp. Wushi-C6]